MALVALGCSDDADGDPGVDGGAVAVEPGEVDPDAESVGAFTLRLVPPDPSTDTPGLTSVIGVVRNAPPPPLLVWQRVAEEGDCFLEEPRSPFCTDCARDEVCVDDDVCVPEAMSVSAGTVTLSGVRTSSDQTRVTIEPLRPINSYQLPSALPYPGFDEGAVVRLEAAGEDVPAFAMEARGIVPLELDGSEDVPVTPGDDLPLRWTAGGEASARIHVEMDISHHGGTRGLVVCDSEDDGELDVPAALVTGLIDLGVSGFPVVDMARHSDGAAMVGEHRVDLTLVSDVTRGLAIPGVTSCFEDTDCAGGETCQFDMQCGE